MPLAARHVLEFARSSGLLTAEQASAVEIEVGQASAKDTASRLVERGVLTAFQAGELTAGRGERLVLSDRYRLDDRLGEGATGTVYRAHDRKLGRSVAVKVLPAETLTDEDTVARFQREAKALGRLSHPSIVEAYDAGQDGDRHYLVMEYVEGVDLAHSIRDRGALPASQVAGWAYQTCVALAHAHSKGLVHRDLKPANLLVTSEGRVKVLDLGLARFVQDTIANPSLTREGMGMGTPDYVAPEQFRDAHSADQRSDLYSLGCTLYHCLTGHVPFPGTSLAEKLIAHEKCEPIPLETACPDCPAGLAMVVRRMMAKRPEDRFESAREAALALGVYVAASSVALPDVQATATWHGSHLLLAKPVPSRARRLALAVGLAVVAGAGFLARGWLAPASTDADTHSAPVPDRAVVPEVAPEDVLTVAQDGSGRFRTIGEALAAARLGATIRVTDAGTYREEVHLTTASVHEGLTVEATRGATILPPSLEATAEFRETVKILDVPRVTLRGFRVGCRDQGLAVGIYGRSQGTTVERIEFLPGGGSSAVHVADAILGPNDPPIVVRECAVSGAEIAVVVNPIVDFAHYHQPRRTGRVVVAGNRFANCKKAVQVHGAAYDVHVVGNTVWGGGAWAALSLENLLPGARDILVANNTVLGTTLGLRLWDEDVRGNRVEVRDNLFLGFLEHADMVFTDSGGNPNQSRGPGDGRLLAARWRVGGNWREARTPADEFDAKSWAPPVATDVLRDEVPVLSRDPASPDFLRPAAQSPLSTGGANAEGLPPWVGAVPPPGAEAWDWAKAWEARQGAVLTVSADANDGGTFRTITEALAQAKPGAVVRVIDGATYAETIRITQKSAHEGLTLEATDGATIARPATTTPRSAAGVWITGVPGVRVSGFRIQDAVMGPLVSVQGHSPGTVLESLTVVGAADCDLMHLTALDLGPRERPVVVRRCTLQTGSFGISVIGVGGNRDAAPCGPVVLRDNRIENCTKAMMLIGAVHDVQIVGNVLWGGGGMASIEFQDLIGGARDILVANNTVFEAGQGFRVWDSTVRGERVEIRGNAFLACQRRDIVVLDSGGSHTSVRGPGDVALVPRRWRMGRNWRETPPPTGPEAASYGWVPPTPDDVMGAVALLSRDPTSTDFLRPAADSPAATGGANAGGLPPWVGALPPKGASPWAWEGAWDARQGAVLTVSKDAAGAGEFRTVHEALAAARPRSVIRVVDGAEYAERLTLDDPAKHEGVTIETERSATLVPDSAPLVVDVSGVADVVIRGFRIRNADAAGVCVRAAGRCPGVRLEDLQLGGGRTTTGVILLGLEREAGALPLVVQRCTFRGLVIGVAVYGHGSGSNEPLSCSGAQVVNNLFVDCGLGVTVEGSAHEVLVAGNRVWGGQMAGLQAALLQPDARAVVFANNTSVRGPNRFRLWDGELRSSDVFLKANILAAGRGEFDAFVVDSGGTVGENRGPGDGAFVAKRWHMERNWRDTPRPVSAGADRGWIPHSSTDQALEEGALLSMDPASADFLRPAKDSPLATGGSGQDDPAYPPWAGAVPPEGAAPWDWTKAWEALVAGGPK